MGFLGWVLWVFLHVMWVFWWRDRMAVEDMIGEVRGKKEKKKKKKNQIVAWGGSQPPPVAGAFFFFFVHQKSCRRWAVGCGVWAGGPYLVALLGILFSF
jgi:hypothetical protein